MKLSLYSFYYFLFLTLLPFAALAQQPEYCGTTQKYLERIAAHPEVEQQQHVLDSITRIPQGSSRSTDSTTVYIIPVVFHVVHNYGAENISDAQIYDALRILNEDFRKRNTDTSNIIADFKGIAKDARIEFRLAQVGPDLECTNGIDRIYSLRTYDGNDDAKLNAWPRTYYLNIWTMAKMANGVAGYAYYPGSVASLQGSYIDGIIILSNYVGSIGTGSVGRSRALTHEIGHYLNLPHTWGNTNEPGVACGDDGIGDTPETAGWTSCNINGSRCNAGIKENVQNYMEYSYCSNMFTADQVNVMRTTLNTPTSGRADLWSNFNIDYTGVNTISYCGPVADMYTNQRFVCEGSSIRFFDASWREDVTSMQWTFDGGTPNTSTDPSPLVTYNTPGWHNVSLSVTAANGANTLVRERYVFVSGATADFQGGFFEDFTDAQSFTQQWVPYHPVNKDDLWHLITGVGYNDNQCVMINNFQGNRYDTDDLISPSVDLGTYNAAAPRYLNYRLATATNTQNPAERNDTLALYYSTDCGINWQLFDNLTGSELYNRGFEWRPFVPASKADWASHSVELTSGMYSNATRFKFQLNSGASGNNVYLDEINIAGYRLTGLNELENVSAFELYPNPTSSQVNLSYNLTSNSEVTVTVINSQGKAVISKQTAQAIGKQQLTLNTETLAAGIYFVSLENNGQRIVKKLVVTTK